MLHFARVSPKCSARSSSSRLISQARRHYNSVPACQSQPDGQNVQGESSSPVIGSPAVTKLKPRGGHGHAERKAMKKTHGWKAEYGMGRFLGLQEPEEKPGMEYDPKKGSFSFSHRLQFNSIAYQSLVVPGYDTPFVIKSLMKQASTWPKLQAYDKQMLGCHRSERFNSTRKRHRGFCLATMRKTFRLIEWEERKASARTSSLFWHREMGPMLLAGERLHHDFLPEDVAVVIETVTEAVPGTRGHERAPPRLSLVWVSVNAYIDLAQQAWVALSRGERPDPNSDIFSPVVQRFCDWFRHTIAKQKEDAREAVSGRGRIPLPRLNQLVPRTGYEFPVVFAFRDKYIWFMWKDGWDGKLVAQYTGSWVLEDGKVDKDKILEMRRSRKQARARIATEEDSRGPNAKPQRSKQTTSKKSKSNT